MHVPVKAVRRLLVLDEIICTCTTHPAARWSGCERSSIACRVRRPILPTCSFSKKPSSDRPRMSARSLSRLGAGAQHPAVTARQRKEEEKKKHVRQRARENERGKQQQSGLGKTSEGRSSKAARENGRGTQQHRARENEGGDERSARFGPAAHAAVNLVDWEACTLGGGGCRRIGVGRCSCC